MDENTFNQQNILKTFPFTQRDQLTCQTNIKTEKKKIGKSSWKSGHSSNHEWINPSKLSQFV